MRSVHDLMSTGKFEGVSYTFDCGRRKLP